MGYGVCAKAAEIRNMTIEILDKSQKAMYLGRMLEPTEMQEEKLKKRTWKAWAKYNTHKADLTNDRLPIELRLRLQRDRHTDNDVWKRILGVDRANAQRHQDAAKKDAMMYCEIP